MAKQVPAGTSFAFDVGVRSLDKQLRRIEALDTKAGVLLAADGVLAGFLFTRGPALLQAPDWIGILAVVSVLVSMALALLGFAARDYVAAPRPEAVARRAAATEIWLKWRFVPNVLRAIDANRKKLTRKARLIGLSLFSLLVGVLTMGAYLGHTILTN